MLGELSEAIILLVERHANFRRLKDDGWNAYDVEQDVKDAAKEVEGAVIAMIDARIAVAKATNNHTPTS